MKIGVKVAHRALTPGENGQYVHLQPYRLRKTSCLCVFYVLPWIISWESASFYRQEYDGVTQLEEYRTFNSGAESSNLSTVTTVGRPPTYVRAIAVPHSPRELGAMWIRSSAGSSIRLLNGRPWDRSPPDPPMVLRAKEVRRA